MKKIFVISVLLVVIGALCAVFFMRGGKQADRSDEKPWTVGDQTQAQTVPETTVPQEIDAVGAFSDLVHVDLREDYAFLSKEETYAAVELTDVLLGVYIYDLDTDGQEEMIVVRATAADVFVDVYEFRDGKAQYAASQKLTLDAMDDISLSLQENTMRHIEARLTIFPKGADRYLCLTVEQQAMGGEYNAYTIVFEYAREALSLKKSYRLRQNMDVVTLMCTDNVTLLYRQAAGQPADADTGVTLAKYDDLATAYKTEFDALGLSAPQVSAENGSLTQYKVTAVASEQHVFDVTVDAGTVTVTENGFLQNFVIRK